jgi:hypothetical protein
MLLGIWKRLYQVAPKITGGCRPLSLSKLVVGAGLRVVTREIVTQWAFPSEVVAMVRE